MLLIYIYLEVWNALINLIKIPDAIYSKGWNYLIYHKKHKMWEKNRSSLIIWRWHLAQRLQKKLEKDWFRVIQARLDEKKNGDDEMQELEKFKDALIAKWIKKVKCIYIVDDEDNVNIEASLIVTSLKLDVPIYISIYNESLGKHFTKIREDLNVINPAKIAAPNFVWKYEKQKNVEHDSPLSIIDEIVAKWSKFNIDGLLLSLFLLFIIIFFTWVIFFKYSENIPWIDSFYFSTVTIATVWYWDMNLLNSSVWTKLFGIFFIFSWMIIVWIFFSLLIERLIRKRYEIEMGRKRYKLKNHIIVCWLWKIWIRIVEELIKRWIEIIVIEIDQNNRFLEVLRSKKIKLFIWDATLPKNLLDIWIESADWIFIMSNNDMRNLEIWLTAMSLNWKISPMLRIYDEVLAAKIRTQLKIPNAYSATSFVSEYMLKELRKQTNKKP